MGLFPSDNDRCEQCGVMLGCVRYFGKRGKICRSCYREYEEERTRKMQERDGVQPS